MEDGADGIDFCTLGMFIIDEIHFPHPAPPVKDILGGAGSYSALGARLLSPPPRSRAVGWIVDAGFDFPDDIRTVINSWRTSCVVRETPDRLTTRGWNGYDGGEQRAFKYLTPKLRLDHLSLPETHVLSRSFHIICSPTRCLDLVRGIFKRLDGLHEPGEGHERPLVIWEPVPDLCTPAELANCLQALEEVNVISPNHNELASFFDGDAIDTLTGQVNRSFVEDCCESWLERGIGRNADGAVVVRAGKSGCYFATRNMSKWVPAFHQPGSEQTLSKVKDPTGGGNAFLGGLAMGLVRGGQAPGLENLEEAVIWGSVAASFAIEQVGIATLTSDAAGETWNGVRVQDRIESFRERLRTYVQRS